MTETVPGKRYRFGATSEQLAIGLLFVAIGVLACLAPAQSDTWWLLRAGADIWRTHSVTLADPYSFTAAGLYWPNHEWLTEVLFYGAFRIGGMPVLTAFCALALLGAWAVSWRLGRGMFEVRFVLFAICLPAMAASFALRPQALTIGAFALTCLLLAEDRIWWLPLLFLIWTNLHGAVALGLIAVAAAACADLVTTRHVPWRLVGVGASCAAATLVSPLGWRLWSFIATSPQRSRIDQLIEWMPPGGSPDVWPFWAVAAALPLAAVVRWKRLDRRAMVLVFIAAALLPLAIQSVRNVAVFLLVGLPALSAILAPRHAAGTVGRAGRGEHVRGNAGILTGATALAASFVALAWLAPAPRLGWHPISPQAMAAVSSCGEPQYNTYGQGGILIWFVPEKRVFIDNRQDPYPIDFLRAAHRLELDGDYQALFDRYGVRCAVVPPASPVATRLGADPLWARRFADTAWAVFTKQ